MSADEHGLRHWELTQKVIGVFYEVYNELGHGFLESVYQKALCFALADAGLVDHARQAMLAASQVHAGAYLGRYVIVVDEDIDPTNTFDVLWVLASRSDPVESIEILRRCWSGPLDPRIHPSKKGFNSRAVIDACRPFEWMKEFPPVAESSPELREKIYNKWKKVIEA